MTRRERVIKSIQFEKTDYLPHNIDLTSELRGRVEAACDGQLAQKLNNHISSYGLSKPQVQVSPGHFRDEYGVVWDKTGADKDIGMPREFLIKDEAEFERYVFPPVDEAFVHERLKELMDGPEDRFKIANIGFSLYERLWTLMGLEDTLYNMVANPKLLHRILEKVCERNMRLLEIAVSYNVDCIMFGDDWGQQNGLVMGPKHWNEFVLPYLSQMYARVKKAGKFIAQHSCGDNRQIMETLAELGLNIYQTYQPEIYGWDYAETMRGKIAIWGGISTQRELPFLTPVQVKDMVRALAARFKNTGGIILSPTHAVPGDVPVENVLAMAEAFNSQ